MSSNLDQKLEEYYSRNAISYDASQLHVDDEHYCALMFLRGVIADRQWQSMLDVGCGTGRALVYLKDAFPGMDLTGVEPVDALREKAMEKDLLASQIIKGDGRALPFSDNSFDCVTAFGILHHVEHPEIVITELLRVARKAVFISDHNIYGWGSRKTRLFKLVIRKMLGFSALKLTMTKGKGYHDTDYDGIFYPFSLFDHMPQLVSHSQRCSLISTKGKPVDLYSEASHIAVLALLS